MLFPWKLLFRFFSALMLLATGGFAAGHDIPLPFSSPPPATAPASGSSTTTTTAPAATDGSTTTTTAPDASTTTTTAPDSTPPVLVTPVPDPAPTTSTTVPAKPTTTTTAPAATPAPGTPSVTPPAVPVDDNAGAVCAAAATTTCGPAEAVPAAGDTHAARVQRCQDWWNSLAAAFTANNEPQWAAKATQIAGQCDAMITRWEQLEQQWAAHHQPKGDHNGDGHPDDGQGQNGDHPAPPAPPRPQQVSRHGEGRH